METGKPGLPSAPVHISTVAAQTEERMDLQSPLTAVYIQTVSPLPTQPPAAAREPATLHLAMPPLYSKETLPFLTLHIAGGLQCQPGLSLAAAAPAARPKSAGKHVCPHCGRDCMKPSVLEKHLRCHTGERPYPCTTCGVSFKTQSNLYKHKRTQAHARLWSESEQSSLSSLDSMSGSRETCTSSLSLDERSEETGSIEQDTLPAETTSPASTARVFSVKTQGSVGKQNALTPAGQKTEANECAKVTIKKQRTENEKPPLTTSRHLPLQRQEATLFSKQWESSVSRGKSQSHESTDSGFSESSDHYPSPGSLLPDHSMDSLSESTKEYLEETPSGPGQAGQEPKYTAREQKSLEERISKLISENKAVVEDKQLENVRPRKTVLSQQGSIDLPMPYTYKDSFHFDMRISKTLNVGLQRNRKPDFYSSVPTQRSNAMEHAPLTRSNSLPFSVAHLQPDRSSPTSCYQSDYVRLVRRESSGQINPTGYAIKPVNQHSSTHRPLVRQTAVDGNHATDGLFTNYSVEEACTGSLSCDGDGGDICGEPSNRKFRRKKAQKFSYNKWYMYGEGTFKKLYNAEKGGDDKDDKGRKCSTNPEQEVVQGLPKRLPAVHKETVTTPGSTINFTSSSATVCHPGCPPAELPLVFAKDLNIKTSQLHTSCSSLKTPLRRNLSLSLLPVSSIGSFVSHQTNSTSRAEAGKMIDVKTHSDSTLQLCGANISSDRKKQKTDDKIIYPPEMETNSNTPTQLLPSVSSSVPQKDTHLSYINLTKTQKHTHKAALLSTCKINANTPSVSTSLATPSTAKASFLPKYQLKLPHAAEPASSPSLHVVDKTTGCDGHAFTSALSPCRAEQTFPSFKTSERKCGDPDAEPLKKTCDIKNTNAFISIQDQLPLPCTATTLCQTETRLNPNETFSLAVVHRQFLTTTITTTSRQNHEAGSCSTSIQPSKSAGGSAPTQLPRPVAPVVANLSATPTITTANSQSSAAAFTALSQSHPHPHTPLSHTQLLPASEQFSSVNSAYSSSNTPVVPCHIVPFDQIQPDAQKVFHVHTADLQICLQIISDEQLALIEPQIERQSVSALSQRHDVEAAAPEVIQKKAQSSVTMQCSNDQKDLDHIESLPTLNMERVKPPVPVQFVKAEPNLHLTERRNFTQATLSTESTPLEALGLSLRPHKYGHVNTVTVTQSTTGNVISTAASLKGVNSGRGQSSVQEHPLSLNCCAEEHRRLSHGGRISPTLSGQHKLSVTSRKTTERPGIESQHNLKNQACNVGTMKAVGETSAYKSSRLDSGETHPPLQVGSLSSFSINKCKASRQLYPQASMYCSNSVESTLSETLNSSKHANMGCDGEGPSDHSAPSQESESEDVSSSTHSEKHLAPFISVSSSIQVERPEDIPAVLTSVQSPTAGLMECCATQKEPQSPGHEESPAQTHSTDQRCCLQARGGAGQSGGTKTDQAQSNGTYTSSPDMTKPEAEDREVKVDSLKQSWLSEQHLSQTHSGMSEYPPQGKSNNLNSCASSSLTSLSNYPQPSLEMNSLDFSQQHWEGSSILNQETQILCESNSCQRITAQAKLTESLNAFSPIQASPQQTQTFSHQDQKQSSIRAVEPGHAAAGNSCTSVRTSASTQHSQHSYPAAGLTGVTKASNHNVLDDNTVPSYPQPEDYQDTKGKAPNDSTGQSSHRGGADITSRNPCVFLCGQLHGYQPAECVTVSGGRPVQSCQDYTEDTSSSDDEGKLIIEL